MLSCSTGAGGATSSIPPFTPSTVNAVGVSAASGAAAATVAGDFPDGGRGLDGVGSACVPGVGEASVGVAPVAGLSLTSIAPHDGWVLESSVASEQGGSLDFTGNGTLVPYLCEETPSLGGTCTM